ncbi:MAG: hypothetical protein JXR83_05295 [Deltaproteobacteria bacterium]|nr:hypothetical protein [Deltaproteobacteria bacterium]
MSTLCPVCHAVVADGGASYCANCGCALDDGLSAAATVPDLDRGQLLEQPLSGPPTHRAAAVVAAPVTLPPWFGEDGQAPDTVPDLDARAIAGRTLTTEPIEARPAPRELETTLELPTSSTSDVFDQPTQPVDRRQRPVPSWLAETIGPASQEELPRDPWAVDDPKTGTQRPYALASTTPSGRMPAAAAPLAPALSSTDTRSVFGPLDAAPVPEPAPPSAPAIALELAGGSPGSPAGQFIPNPSVVPVTPFSASSLPVDYPEPDAAPDAADIAPELPLYTPHAAFHQDQPASAMAAPALSCWQCGTPIAPRSTYYRISGRPWCATCAEPYLPRQIRSLGQVMLLLAKLTLLVGAMAATFWWLSRYRLVGAIIAGALMFLLLFFRPRRSTGIKRIDPVKPG